MISLNYNHFNELVDERIDMSNDIRNVWGSDVFSRDGRLQNNEEYPLDPYTLLGIVQNQQEQIIKLEERIELIEYNNSSKEIDDERQ